MNRKERFMQWIKDNCYDYHWSKSNGFLIFVDWSMQDEFCKLVTETFGESVFEEDAEFAVYFQERGMCIPISKNVSDRYNVSFEECFPLRRNKEFKWDIINRR